VIGKLRRVALKLSLAALASLAFSVLPVMSAPIAVSKGISH
jgi:hypothetical protein